MEPLSWVDLGWVDIGLLTFLLVSVVFGLTRGLVFEVLSALGWIAAYFAARWSAPLLSPLVHIGGPGSALGHGVAFASAFVVSLIVWSLAARLLRALVRATPLSPIDRLLGAGFGLLRGVLVLLVFVMLVGLTPLRNSPAWQQSEGAVWLSAALQGIRPWLPSSLLEQLPAGNPTGLTPAETRIEACVASSA